MVGASANIYILQTVVEDLIYMSKFRLFYKSNTFSLQNLCEDISANFSWGYIQITQIIRFKSLIVDDLAKIVVGLELQNYEGTGLHLQFPVYLVIWTSRIAVLNS